MDFDKQQLEANIIDALIHGETTPLVRGILRHLSSFGDNVVYSPEGLAKMLQRFRVSRSAGFRALNQLEARKIIVKLDEYSLQLNPQFSSKTAQPVRYRGPVLTYAPEHVDILDALNKLRLELWALRGKNKRIIKDDDMITKAMVKEIKDLKDTVRELSEMMKLMLQKPDDTETRHKVEQALEKQNHLRLVENNS